MRNIILFAVTLFLTNSDFIYSQSIQDTSVTDISLKTYVEQETVPLNREVQYIVQLSWVGELGRYKISEVLEPDVTNLIVRGTGSSNKVFTDKNGNSVSTKKITFYFKPIELGMAYINGVTVRYDDIVLGKSESLLASRIGVSVTDPIPDENEQNYFQYLIYLFLFGLITLGIYIFVIYKKRKKENELKEAEEVKETIEEKYLGSLNDVLQKKENNYPQKLNEIHRLIIGYFSELFGIPLLNKSSEEILNMLSENKLDENQYTKFKEFIEKSDLIRFAANKVSQSDFHQLYDSIEWILEKRKNENAQKEDE